MEAWEQEFYISQIMSGVQYVQLNGRTYIFDKTSVRDRYIANQIYKQNLLDAESKGLYDDETIVEFLIERGFWTKQDEYRLENLKEEIENACINLYEARLKSNLRKTIREKLASLRKEEAALFERRHEYDYLTANHAAFSAKIKYLVGSSLYYESGKKYWKDRNGWKKPNKTLEKIIFLLHKQNIPADYYRELARCNHWRQIWAHRKACGTVFGVSASELTDSQKALLFWTITFDNIYQSQECPSDEVIEDDDMLDGWIIFQRRKKEAEQNKQGVMENLQNSKIANAQEVFVVAETQADAEKVFRMNSAEGNRIRRQRWRQIQEAGQMNELEMMDTKREIQMMINKQGN
jgi:hypothetical protein